MPLVPFAAFGPDRSPFDSSYCDRVENVLPIQGGWGPFPSFRALPGVAPLPELPPMGAALVYVSNGAYRLFAGTQHHLYMLNTGTLAWDDKSKAGGYNGAVGIRWGMTQYGDNFLASNGQDNPQWIDVTTATAFADMPTAPKAYNIDAVGDFVFLSHLQSNQRMCQWSGLNQPFFWTPRQQSSDFQAFPDGGEIMGTASSPNGLVIFSAESIREGTLALETPLVFNFKVSVPNHGCLAPKSIISTGEGIFYYSDDGFYKYANPPTPIGLERIDKWFLDNVAADAIYDMYGGEDPIRKIVYWAFQSRNNALAATFDKILLYHYSLDQWSLLNPGILLTGMIDATYVGKTLDGLNSIGDLDHLPFSLDSRAWSGSTPVVAAFDQNGYLGFFDEGNPPMQAILQTGDAQLNEATRTMIFGWRPLTDAATLQGNVATKEYPGDTPRWRSYIGNNRVGIIPQQVSGLFHRFELTIPSTQTNPQYWTAAHGLEPIDAQPDGEQ